jgi:hypothetical protein
MPSSFVDTLLNATFLVAAGMQCWYNWRLAQEEYAERAQLGIGGNGGNGGGWNRSGGGGGGSGRPRQAVVTTPQGERIVVLASEEALREMGLLPPGGEQGGQEAAAAADEEEEEIQQHQQQIRVLRRLLGGGGGRGGNVEFGPDDYEALSSLDDGLRPPSRAAPVSQELLDVLPTHEHHSRRRSGASGSSSGAAAAATANDNNDNKETCSVCLQDFAESETVRTLPCLHHFHLGCVDPWLKQKGRNLAACPVCKTKVFA